MKPFALIVLILATCFQVSQAGQEPTKKEAAPQTTGCSNFAGRYTLQGEDGVVYFTIRQKKCERVEISSRRTYVKVSVTTEVFIPDGKPHGKGIPISQWVGKRLQIGRTDSHVYYDLDVAGNLHMSDGRTYPQCNGPCDQIAERIK